MAANCRGDIRRRKRGIAQDGEAALFPFLYFVFYPLWDGGNETITEACEGYWTFLKWDGWARLAVRRRPFTTFLSSSREGIFSTLCRNEVMTTNHNTSRMWGYSETSCYGSFLYHRAVPEVLRD
ncbi:hypothetical protein CORC01_08146 [Colletotrichum orchidophilum]|uniref:Uncharacterized protein n=1 Tax=Colletotrichum orchidophilum TaxID=1209926 RepID=A0A1G4B532_9PEZI|nr:uncharacterized protein CORC01_08146 [Colletotrichum orchidophilum]OHE96548.1 hypothetical protein CORC01_08146 [Colletotrichum orchidophilum]